MSEIDIGELFAPKGGWKVRILDLSGGAEDNIVEDVPGFPTLMLANAFARRYVRDSIERCRVSGATAREVLDVWFAFGEDAHALDAGDDTWRSATELAAFAETQADDEDCNWRALDPRLNDDPEEDEE